MKIEIINVQASTKPTKNGGTYTQLDVAYKNLTFNGKVEGRKIMSFTNKDVFAVLERATTGQVFEVTVTKEGQYNQWTAIASGDASASSGSTSMHGLPKANNSPKSTYETPEERATRQRMIVRQSSLSNAIDTLKTEKNTPTSEDVIGLATIYYDWVMSNATTNTPSILDALPEDDDIPM